MLKISYDPDREPKKRPFYRFSAQVHFYTGWAIGERDRARKIPFEVRAVRRFRHPRFIPRCDGAIASRRAQ